MDLGSSFEVGVLFEDILLTGAAFLFAAVIGWERQRAHRPAGLRTFPLVAVASCAYILVGQSAFADSLDSQARIIQGLVAGIGFIGGGAILKSSADHVHGIATAASIWNTGAIGAAVAYRRFDIALVLTILNFAILRWLPAPAESE